MVNWDTRSELAREVVMSLDKTADQINAPLTGKIEEPTTKVDMNLWRDRNNLVVLRQALQELLLAAEEAKVFIIRQGYIEKDFGKALESATQKARKLV